MSNESKIVSSEEARDAIRQSAMKKIASVKLPDTLSALIRVAVADMKKVAQMPGFELDMSVWAHVNFNGECQLCAAGAMLYNEAQLTKDEIDYAWPSGLNTAELAAMQETKSVADKMRAINNMRMAFDYDCWLAYVAKYDRRTCIVDACLRLLPCKTQVHTEIEKKCQTVFTNEWFEDHGLTSVSKGDRGTFYYNLLAAADLLASVGL